MAVTAVKRYSGFSPSIEPALSDLEKRLLNDYQKCLPMSLTPYADIASELGVSEALVLELLKKLKHQGYISRIGPVFKPKRVGVSTLAAMSVPSDRLQTVAQLINSYKAVNHNYEREHHFNLWFVVTAKDSASLRATLDDMEQRSGLPVLDLPLEHQFHIDLGFPLWC